MTLQPPVDDDVVQVRGLRMSYGTHDVLTGVDFDVHAGEVVCLLGPNGAGKTTTIEILEGFRIRSARRGHACSARTRRMADEDWRARVGRRPPVVARPPALDAAPAADPAGRLLRARTPRPSGRGPYDVDWLLETVGLTELADRKIGTLSGGQRRRLDVAVGIVGRPELLFLDEPTAGFDPQARREFHDLVHRLVRPRGHDASCSPPTTWPRPSSWPTGS